MYLSQQLICVKDRMEPFKYFIQKLVKKVPVLLYFII
eukprot:UN27264